MKRSGKRKLFATVKKYKRRLTKNKYKRLRAVHEKIQRPRGI